jgi:peptidoglycan/xylan/chitin deacetylase (PgdA/CDA1 family)
MFYTVQTPQFIQHLLSGLTWFLPSASGKRLYLTFDDGPIPELTPWVLAQLKAYNAKATFFCVGANVQKHPSIYQSILDQGHAVGNHTFSHCNGWKKSANLYLEEVQQCSKFVQSNLFRPPYGKLMPRQYRRLKKQYNIIMWDVIAGDFDARLSAQQCLENILNNAKSGSIVVLHDSLKAKQKLIEVLPLVLAHYQRQGYAFDSIVLP